MADCHARPIFERIYAYNHLIFSAKMGMKFGNLGVRVRGVVQYSLSPHEQRAFAGAISHGVPNLARRFAHQFFRVAPRKSDGQGNNSLVIMWVVPQTPCYI